MGLNTILFWVVIIYILSGGISLFIFDLITKRVRTKFNQAAGETQSKLAASGNYVGGKVALILFLGAMWVFWPAVFVGALTDKTDKKEDSHGA